VVVVALLVASLLCCACTRQEPNGLVLSSGPGADVSSPAVRAQLADRIGHHLRSHPGYSSVRAVLVEAEGHTVFEHYYHSSLSTSRDVESVTESVMSILVGIALAEGRLGSVDQTLAELLPTYASSMKPGIAATSLRQVLTATAGFAGDTDSAGGDFAVSDDWTRAILDGTARPAGEAFGHSDGGAHLLSAILVQATGQSVLSYARAKLFDPLGIKTRPAVEQLPAGADISLYKKAAFAWPLDPQGRQLGWALLKLRPRDMAKIGMLYLNEGRWHGKQVVPAAWVRQSTVNQLGSVPTRSASGDGYGYLWWTGNADGDPEYLAYGFGGQMIEVIPRRHLVIVVSTELELDDPDGFGVRAGQLRYLAESVIAPVFRR
jgi:CubicO group peptidase (beta-lactamase class C family)